MLLGANELAQATTFAKDVSYDSIFAASESDSGFELNIISMTQAANFITYL